MHQALIQTVAIEYLVLFLSAVVMLMKLVVGISRKVPVFNKISNQQAFLSMSVSFALGVLCTLNFRFTATSVAIILPIIVVLPVFIAVYQFKRNERVGGFYIFLSGIAITAVAITVVDMLAACAWL